MSPWPVTVAVGVDVWTEIKLLFPMHDYTHTV